jgi:ABC-type lipoprotein release transport system permease subunit
MALVVVLSVFNGFHDMIASRLSVLNSPLKVEAVQGKVIENADSLSLALKQLPQVAEALPEIEERALAVMDGHQTAVRMRGVMPQVYTAFDSTITLSGEPWLNYFPDVAPAVISVGVANSLFSPVGTEHLLGLYVPRRLGRINPANPMAAFRTDSVAVTAIYAVNQSEMDADVVYVPLATARQLLQYTTQASALSITAAQGVTEAEARDAIVAAVGADYRVLDSIEQQSGSFQVVNMEKWTSFMLLGFILLIASFNIVSTLSLLIIEKDSNAQTLLALGASESFVKRIYIIEGFLITLTGGIFGMIVGALLCLGQHHYGWVKFATSDPSMLSIDAYPVLLQATDLLPISLLILLIGAATALIASRKA